MGQLEVKTQHKLHLSPFKNQPDFKKGCEAPASGIDCKIQNKIIKPPPKEQPEYNHKKTGNILSQNGSSALGSTYFITWLKVHDKGMQTIDFL